MKTRLIAAVVFLSAVSFLATGCDDIHDPIDRPVLKKKEKAKPRAHEIEPEEMTVDKMKEITNYIYIARKELRDIAARVEKAKETQSDDYLRRLKIFEIKKDRLVRKLKVRKEWLTNAPKPEDRDYPAYTLIHAIRLLIREANLYHHSFTRDGSAFDPAIDKEVLDTLEKAEYRIRQLEKKQEEKDEKNKEDSR